MNATPRQRYMTRMMIAIVAYGISIVAAGIAIETRQAGAALAFALAIVPGLAVTGMFYALGMYIIELKDEFMRMLLVRQQLIAMGFTMSLAALWGFLEEFGQVEHIPGFWIVVLWAVGTLLGALSNRMSHGSWGPC